MRGGNDGARGGMMMRGERDDNDVRDAGGWHVKGDRR